MNKILIRDIEAHLKTHFNLKTFPLEKYKIGNFSDLAYYIEFKKNIYNKKIIFRNESFEIVLISWWNGVTTNFHKHPQNGCKLKVIFGKLIEILKLNNNNNKISYLTHNKVSYLDDSIGIHKIEALEPSLSLHIYSPPCFYDNK